MYSLDKAVELVLQWPADRKKDRDEIISLLEGTIKDCRNAIQVWQGYLDTPGDPGDQWTLVSWMGPERVKKLHEINLSAKEHIKRVSDIAGPETGRFVIFDEDVIEMAYRQLRPDETGPDAAKAAIQHLGKRIDHIHDLIERIRTTKPAIKKTSKARTARKAAGKRPPKKKKAGKAGKTKKKKPRGKASKAKK